MTATDRAMDGLPKHVFCWVGNVTSPEVGDVLTADLVDEPPFLD